MTSDPTIYGGKYPAAYYFILISHILLSIAVIPIVLLTYLFAWEGDFERHKKWNRFAFPIWLYVAKSKLLPRKKYEAYCFPINTFYYSDDIGPKFLGRSI